MAMLLQFDKGFVGRSFKNMTPQYNLTLTKLEEKKLQANT